ncbi:MAG: DUF2179 domain-containing protein [Tissierellia bacterium]|nr:DUF2179 domain-containing protein [Tissierellia bacterium]
MIYLLIVLVKTIEVSLATLRIKLITKGQRIFGALVGFVEIIMWVVIVSTVLNDMSSDPLKVLAYALGFSFGNYFGVLVEEWIGLGSTKIEVILPQYQSEDVVKEIRSLGYGVTEIEGTGKDEKRSILLIILPRKSVDTVRKILEETNAFVTITDIKPVYGGYGTLKK